jgi:DNA-binding transcriptional ArsR family regulator
LGGFTYYVRPTSTLRNFTFIAILPSTAILSQQSAVPVYPSSDFNWTDGTSLSFSWFTSELQPGQERVYIVKYQIELPSTNPTSFIVEFLLFILAGIALGSVLTLGVPRVIQRMRTIGAVRIAGITQEEEVLLDVIRRKGGSCAQKELYTEFDMSQSRVSLTLTNLEQRGLIRRIREGRVNMVYIVEES